MADVRYDECLKCLTKECFYCFKSGDAPSNFSDRPKLQGLYAGRVVKFVDKRPQNTNSTKGPDWGDNYDAFLGKECVIVKLGKESNFISISFIGDNHKWPVRADWLEALKQPPKDGDPNGNNEFGRDRTGSSGL